MEYLKRRATLVYLEDSFENIEARLGDASNRGIIGLRYKPLREIYEERKPLYSRWADLTLNCWDKSPERLAQEILNYYLRSSK